MSGVSVCFTIARSARLRLVLIVFVGSSGAVCQLRLHLTERVGIVPLHDLLNGHVALGGQLRGLDVRRDGALERRLLRLLFFL